MLLFCQSFMRDRTIASPEEDFHSQGKKREERELAGFWEHSTMHNIDEEYNRTEKVLDDGQPCEQAGFRKEFGTMGHIHTASKLIEVSREYKMPLYLTFFDLKKAFEPVRVKIDGRQLHHFHFIGDIILITSSISQAEGMLTEFDETCRCMGLQLNLQTMLFIRNGWVSDATSTLNGTNISECTGYVYLGQELNMMKDLTPELGRRRRAVWGAYKSMDVDADVVKKTKNARLTAHFFNSTTFLALVYASETWSFRNQEENDEKAVSIIVDPRCSYTAPQAARLLLPSSGVRSFIMFISQLKE
ncbi:hypothetical protein RB195_025297 [Necator americanus]|uniref:Reverse transcriptase domain-containing protein n=1 Tax=Necator americanus TaxID=51031 RepID=A0ABR1ERP8_NECAM